MKFYKALLLVVVIGVTTGFCVQVLPQLQRFISHRLYGNIVVDVDCQNLPTYSTVQSLVSSNRNEILKIVSIGIENPQVNKSFESIQNENRDSVDLFTGPFVTFRLEQVCGDKILIRMTAGGTKDYEKIKQIIGETFHGVPYQIDNI
jgi:hypothetical protein